MPTITDWLMVIITFVYVAATILICIFNGRSAKATQEQVAESQRQFDESKRLEFLPFFQIENGNMTGRRRNLRGDWVSAIRRSAELKAEKRRHSAVTF